MVKEVVLLKVALPVFGQMSKAVLFLFFGLKPQDNNRQKKVWDVLYKWGVFQ